MERHLQDDPSHLGREGTHADASTRRHLQYWMHHKPEEQRFGISATWPMTADWDKRNLILNSLGEFKTQRTSECLVASGSADATFIQQQLC